MRSEICTGDFAALQRPSAAIYFCTNVAIQGNKICFGVFEVRLEARELRKHGVRIKLEDQPFEILTALLEKPGDIVSRSELQARVWPGGTFVDFDKSLNKAVNKIRTALGDSAAAPQFIETLSRRGYRFIPPVTLVEEPHTPATTVGEPRQVAPGSAVVLDDEQSLNKTVDKLREALGDSADRLIYVETLASRGYRFLASVKGDGSVAPVATTAAPRRRVPLWLLAGGLVLAVVLATGLWPIDVPRVERVLQLTNDTSVKRGRVVSDGNKVLYCDGKALWSVPGSGGEPRKLPLPFLRHVGWMALVSYSCLRQQVLLSSDGTGKPSATEFWLAGTEGEAPRKIGDCNQTSEPCPQALAPDAERIALSGPGGIYIQSITNGQRKRVYPAPLSWWTDVWWHPSGHILGFVLPKDDWSKTRVWQVNDDGTHLRRIEPEREHIQLGGAWSQDGKRFFYTSEAEIYLRVQAGILGWLRTPVVTQLTTSGLFQTEPTVDPVNPKRVYAVGTVLRGQTMRFDLKARRWVPFQGGFSGEQIDRSPDGQWLAYIPFPGREPHKRRIDGSGDVLLAPGVRAVNPKWSPDGTRIAFSDGSKLWLVSSGGGDAAPYRPEVGSGSDQTWSADGKRLLLGQEEAGLTPQSCIRILHLETGRVEVVPGTHGLFSPRWSPDEKQILALEVDTGHPHIFDTVKNGWRALAQEAIGWPTWSRDGKYIYGMTAGGSAVEAFRIEVATGRHEEIARADFGAVWYWVGWTQDWEPLTIRDLSSIQIYRLDLDR
jgi:DNA-binding winged helix-turn-helix (wHTH) protein/Tol biopolymer transport system component